MRSDLLDLELVLHKEKTMYSSVTVEFDRILLLTVLHFANRLLHNSRTVYHTVIETCTWFPCFCANNAIFDKSLSR